MRSHGKVYLHVGNSGATIEVGDEGHGPTLQISTGAFGNLNHQLKIHTTKEGLLELAILFAKAADAMYSEPYCHAAAPVSQRRDRDSQGEKFSAGEKAAIEKAGEPPPPPDMTTTTVKTESATEAQSQ